MSYKAGLYKNGRTLHQGMCALQPQNNIKSLNFMYLLRLRRPMPLTLTCVSGELGSNCQSIRVAYAFYEKI